MSRARTIGKTSRQHGRRPRGVVAVALGSAVALALGALAAPAYAGGPDFLDAGSTAEPATVTSGDKVLFTIDIFNPTESEGTLVTDIEANVYTSSGGFDLKAMKPLNGNKNICEELISTFSTDVEAAADDLPSQITCEIPDLDAGQGFDLRTVVDTTGAAPPTLFLDADVFGDPGSAFVHEEVAVQAATPDHSAGYVPPGGTIDTGTTPTLDDLVVTQFKLPKKVSSDSLPFGAASQVPGLGTTVTIDETASSTDATFCDGEECYGQLVTVSDFPNYHDPKKPASVIITWFGTTVGKDSVLYGMKPGDLEASPVPKCIKFKGAYTNMPCLKKHAKKKGNWQSTILLLSGDPVFGRK